MLSTHRALLLALTALLAAPGLPARGDGPEPQPPGPKPPAPAPAPTPAPRPPDSAPAAKPATGSPKTPKPEAHKQGTPKPYKEVITAEAKSDPGMFTAHQIDDKLYFEIPVKMLNREMLWSEEIAQLPAGQGYGGTSVGNWVVRWTRRNNKIYLRTVSHAIRADGLAAGQSAIQRAIEAASLEPIVMAFDVEAEGPGRTAVIDVTRLFTSDVAEFSARSALGGGGLDMSRSYLEHVKSFPENIETRSVLTFTGAPAMLGQFPFVRRSASPKSITAVIHYSLNLLPEVPMRGRLSDSRVGFFSEEFEDYGRPEHRVVERQYIARYRLEKKDPSADVSEPVKPITYYVSREVPEKWRPAIKRAVEAWRGAFEQAGFRNAIRCLDAPSVEEDPNWDPEDSRYSVIRWAPTETENAMGPHVHDPRSGEIISAHVIIWHNVLKLAETWYFTQVGPLDPRARRLPLPDSLMSEILEGIVTHEVGHTLGLEHNFKASSAYSIPQLRDRRFTDENGDEASIMAYGRFNYVAQPGDQARLIQKIGPYDRFAIEWGYRPLPSCSTPDDEKTELDRMAARQVDSPFLRFGGGGEQGHAEDPTQQTENVGSDAIEATRLGLKNIARVAKMLVPATTTPGEDYSLLEEMYGATMGQRDQALRHVASVAGGVIETDYHAGRGGEVFQPVPKARQARAVAFLVREGLRAPTELLLPEILNRIEPSGVTERVLGSQRMLLTLLLIEPRVKRLLDQEALLGDKAYTVRELVTDLQGGVWSEISQPRPVVGLYRRNLQRAYLEVMRGKLVGDGATQTDLRPVALGALRDLQHNLDAALRKTKDPATILHLQDCRRTVDRILNPRT